jgi:hypothetical protein
MVRMVEVEMPARKTGARNVAGVMVSAGDA